MKRRNFLQNSSAFLSVPFLLNGMPISAASSPLFWNAINEDNDKVLVLIQLNGGNDGLNTIIPIDKYDILANARANVIIPSSNIIELSDQFGLHPNMTGIKALYDDAKATILQDVGYPNQNRSHFRSLDIWTSGSPADEVWNTGWLGRYFQGCHPDYPQGYPNNEFQDPFALSIGSSVSETCQGTITNFSLALTDPLSIRPLSNNAVDEVPDTPYGRELEFLRTTIEQANAYGTIITEAAQKGSNVYSEYPDSNLANQLRAISLLISGGLRTKVFVANIGGFDTHANQVDSNDTRLGEHAELLATISEAVYAFQQDLILHGLEEQVLTMTFSEFGRRIRSNGSLGTDHGTAAPMMFFGSCVNAGMIGESPFIPDNPGVSDGVPMQYDFRSVYGSILIDWFGIESNVVQEILQEEFTPIDLIKNCNQTTPTEDIDSAEVVSISNYPNPFSSWTRIALVAPGGFVRISLFDAIGHEVDIITNKVLPKGDHEIQYDGSRLAPGNYFCRVICDKGIKTLGLVKI